MVSGMSLKFLMGGFTVLFTVHGIKWTCSNGNSSSGFSVEQLVQQILDSHQTKPQPRTHNCLCTGTLGEFLGRAQNDHSLLQTWRRVCSTEGVKVLYPETLRHDEFRGDTRSLEHKKMQLELLEKASTLCNMQVLINVLCMWPAQKGILSSTCSIFVTKASKSDVLPTSCSELLALQPTLPMKMGSGS